jgi:7,8-dihydropterin-6-yl-methyl-4-(beta-D-ribofuranosyl)aminobenzene 5'-phosphate synthase
MDIKILFDKNTNNKKYHTGWGVSFLIDDKILFDTGEKGEWLIENMRTLQVDITGIEAVVISHDHWDHSGGLWKLLERRPELKIYICPHFSQEFKKRVKSLKGDLIEQNSFLEISKNIYLTGEISGKYKGKFIAEQALVLKTVNGLTLLTGCAHPGIVKILEKAQEKFPGKVIYLVFGGFHLMDKDKRAIEIIVERFKEMKVQNVGPTHCSGRDAEEIFRREYGKNFIEVKTGTKIEV